MPYRVRCPAADAPDPRPKGPRRPLMSITLLLRARDRTFAGVTRGDTPALPGHTNTSQRPPTDHPPTRQRVRALYGPQRQRLPPLAWLDVVLPVPPPFS